MYVCRPATRDDFPIVAAFPQSEDELFFMFPSADYPLRAEQLEANARDRLFPTVVTDDAGAVAGYANIYGYTEGSHCSLGNVIVSPDHRGRGAARFLIETMIAKARDELRVPRLVLTCHHPNTRGMLFYDKLGFKPFGLKKITNRRGDVIVGILFEMHLHERI
ncbi:GNAT family N-acetyltransferase [Paenibacillus flagellatus]|uniref:N-acetyltransferase n=1 Tax=Paenibacillus flagellatus TaxID=2211139 RepID=A0A2V5KAC2_9BACL|nr:GNAT family N-acetyltransferase [Paenibacillus flagellatus]PYI54803.1 N-acetyltransferase [Paenibacillus flagellatus]